MTATRSLSASLRHLNHVLLADDAAELPDAELVRRFVERRDEAAFTALVRRYGGVVLGVCRRVLRHEQDAEDAFQATFLVFARHAASVGRAGAIGNWLYGVAYNVARKARAMRHRREAKEREAATRPTTTPAAVWDDLREVLDAELRALPDKYRTALVLCDLLGLTTREAAAEAGCPPKTMGTWLGRGRSLLARRLVRRGLAVPAAALAVALGPAAAAAVPPRLIESTVRAATGFAAGSAAAVSPAVAALTHGASKVMLVSPLKCVAVLVSGVVVAAGLSHGPAIVAAHTGHGPGARSGGDGVPTAGRPVPPARQRDLLADLHYFLHGLFVSATSSAAPADDKDDGKDKPALSGVWERKEGELKLAFEGRDVLKISPHGKDEVILVVCSYTVDKDGLVKGKVTNIEGSAKDRLKEKLPVGTEFGFKWKVDKDTATLADLKGEKFEAFKSSLEGDFTRKT